MQEKKPAVRTAVEETEFFFWTLEGEIWSAQGSLVYYIRGRSDIGDGFFFPDFFVTDGQPSVVRFKSQGLKVLEYWVMRFLILR